MIPTYSTIHILGKLTCDETLSAWSGTDVRLQRMTCFLKEVDQIKEHSIIINDLPHAAPDMSTDDETFMEDISVQPPVSANDDNIPEDIDTGVNRRDLNTTTPILRRSPRTLERENQGIATRTRSRVNFDTTLRDRQSVNLIIESDVWDTDLTVESHKEYMLNHPVQQ